MALVNNRPVAESVPYAVAVERGKDAVDETLREDDRKQLLDQIVALKEKVVKLEQDREHWMLETQLVKIKSEKRAALDAVKEGGRREEDETDKSALGTVNVEIDEPPSDNGASSPQSREDVIKEHYMARIQELTAQLQVADSKSLHFYTDSVTLQVGQHSFCALVIIMKRKSYCVSIVLSLPSIDVR